jgi:hypothetical protein
MPLGNRFAISQPRNHIRPMYSTPPTISVPTKLATPWLNLPKVFCTFFQYVSYNKKGNCRKGLIINKRFV